MINRYDVPEVSSLWHEEKKFEYFLKVEMALLEALEESKLVPKVSSQFAGVKINPARISEIEATTHHDIIAFCSSITEQVSPEIGKFFHFGCTSSDIIDTALSLQLKDSIDLELSSLKELLKNLALRAEETKDLPSMGRSHGMYAENLLVAMKNFSNLKIIFQGKCPEQLDHIQF
jgi:adenylosuccinate lyase